MGPRFSAPGEPFPDARGYNLPFKEIAAVVGVTENTVNGGMRYALERLQAALSEFEEYARALR
jgi:RNA polymerase sigma-70 factor (ECF subfamily)